MKEAENGHFKASRSQICPLFTSTMVAKISTYKYKSPYTQKYVQKSTNKYKSAPVEPTMVAKSPTGFFHQSGIMMDQFARGFVQKLCMLVCQKIIRWR